jgi:hypothetical protein
MSSYKPEISVTHQGPPGGEYRAVWLDDELVFKSCDSREAEMFAAELKGRIKIAQASNRPLTISRAIRSDWRGKSINTINEEMGLPVVPWESKPMSWESFKQARVKVMLDAANKSLTKED